MSAEHPRSVADLLAHLQRLEVRVWVDGDRLRLSTPKGAISPELRDELVSRKAELIALLNSSPDAGNGLKPVDRAARSGEGPFVAPLSSAQERMWFFEQLNSNAANQLVMGLQFHGVLHAGALRQALDGLVERHESLRTTFSSLDGGPVQVIAAAGTVAFELREVRTPGDVHATLAAEAERPFDLERGPLLRALLLVLGPERHILLLTIHHIVSDGFSLGVLIRELSTLYDAAVHHAESPLPPMPTQYADYARWQRAWLLGDTLAAQVAYWRRRLRGTLPVLELPTDHPRPPIEAHRGERITVSLSAVAVPELRALGRREHATLFMVLLAAFAALLTRYTGQEDVIVGTPVGGRSRPEWEGLIGLFVNTLVLRTDTGEDPAFLELVRRVRDTSIDAYENQEVPFERLVEDLRPARDPSRNPIFQVMFDLQNLAPAAAFFGLEMQPVIVDRGAAQLDLTLSVLTYDGRLHTQWEYNTDLFDRATIERFAHHYEQLLVSALADPTQHLSRLSMLTVEDELQPPGTGSGGNVVYDTNRCVHTLLEESARANPAMPAVVAGSEALTYAELDAHANRLAHLLVSRGVTPGARVAICLDRTVDLPVALAAVLKVGAAYVPLDPTHPAERLQYTVEDADVACILTLASFAERFEQASAPRVLLDEVEPELVAQPSTPVKVETNPGSVAYVIYTSGSTGRPKGVEVEHRNVVSFLEAMRDTPGCTAHDVLLAVTTVAFDIAGLEIWLPLSVGGRVVLAARGDVLDGERLMTLIREQRVTILQATPATWRLLLDAGWTGTPTLKALCGGEALPRELAAALVPRVAELWNMYGPTETTIWSTLSRITDANAPITIGRPIAHTRVYVREPSGQLAPPGVPGELCIAGAGVARGYHRRPELTAEKFATLVLPGERTERVYCTGDVVRARSDGQLEYRGRRDQQIKLRGYRIELGEIETVLATHPGLTAAAVALRADPTGDPRLVAYVVADPTVPFDLDAVRASLRASLPEYMVPSAFVTLPELPLTPNGKVDRGALPTPTAPARATPAVADGVMTTTQRRVANVWQEILRIDRVGIYDNFFDIGGHSLLLIKLHAALKAEFNVDLMVVELFQHTTVASQATRVTSAGPSDAALRRAQARAARQISA